MNPNKPCPHCGIKNRAIKVGKTQTKIKKQKYFCYACRKQFTEEITNPRAPVMNSSGVTAKEEMNKEE